MLIRVNFCFNFLQKEKGLKYIWCGENVWLSTTQISAIIVPLNAAPLKFGRPQNAQQRSTIWDAFRGVAAAIVKTLFVKGVKGGELFNYYKNYSNPLTEKKMRIVSG